jgi:hypothetical protein
VLIRVVINVIELGKVLIKELLEALERSLKLGRDFALSSLDHLSSEVNNLRYTFYVGL